MTDKHDDNKTEELINPEDEISSLQDRILRKCAEFDNFKKRVDKEKESEKILVLKRIFSDILPVLDNFDRALQHIEKNKEDVNGLIEGINLVYKDLTKVLLSYDVKPIDSLGQTFNPRYHEAVQVIEPNDGESVNIVVNEFEKGYEIKSMLLRPAKVVISGKKH